MISASHIYLPNYLFNNTFCYYLPNLCLSISISFICRTYYVHQSFFSSLFLQYIPCSARQALLKTLSMSANLDSSTKVIFKQVMDLHSKLLSPTNQKVLHLFMGTIGGILQHVMHYKLELKCYFT